MAYGIQRLNAKRSQPNPHIVFIKPLAGPDEKIAQDFLERIAAQCLPVMRDHTLSVMSLEEFPPNREFVGRNFNAGEVIQLVLKSPSTGRWLPFEYVQMVMMHELAHCKQMNHSKAFWAVRNTYATKMYGLMRTGYTGEGIWGRGVDLASGAWARNTVLSDEVLPEHLCGGTYRSRGRKRKARKPELTWKEKKERRIEKKFGRNGMALGSDEGEKIKLEKGKKIAAKPRVAGSARGRELRAAAALARFDKPRLEPDVKEETDTGSGSETEYEDTDPDSKDAIDLDGSKLLDQKGRGMIKICEDEGADDPGAQDEVSELRDVLRGKVKTEPIELSDNDEDEAATSKGPRPIRMEDIPELPSRDSPQPRAASAKVVPASKSANKPGTIRIRKLDGTVSRTAHKVGSPGKAVGTQQGHRAQGRDCPVCTYSNAGTARRCDMCSHVLDPKADPSAWACHSTMCKDKGYVNAGDCGVCGLCGGKKLS